MKKYTKEFIGTFWLVLSGCINAALSVTFPQASIGLPGVSLIPYWLPYLRPTS